MTKPAVHLKSRKKYIKAESFLLRLLHITTSWWHANIWHRIAAVLAAILILWTTFCYGIAQWYIYSTSNKPVLYGATFISSYAQFFGLDPQDTLHAILYDLGISRVRLVSYWNEIEPNRGQYDFSQLDWQFKMAEQAGVKISLAIGLRQPRWPECHMPYWASDERMDTWEPQLKDFMGKVIDRYKTSPALESYQLENEFFLSAFGICPDFSRSRLVDEYNFVKQADSSHPVIVSRSNNIIGIPMNDPIPDVSGVSVYKRVWDRYYTHRYLEYPFPAWFYAMLAGGGKLLNGTDMVIHEVQAEPWLPDGYEINDLGSISEQNKSMDAKRLASRIEYARGTGIKEMYLWGVEWWYWRKVKANDPSLWDTAKREFQVKYHPH